MDEYLVVSYHVRVIKYARGSVVFFISRRYIVGTTTIGAGAVEKTREFLHSLFKNMEERNREMYLAKRYLARTCMHIGV